MKKIIQYSGQPTHPDVLSWKDVMDLGAAESESELLERHASMYVNQCICLIYTSGTTGNPKVGELVNPCLTTCSSRLMYARSQGVMLSHDNVIFTCNATLSHIPWCNEHIISYLPLSHIAALMLDVFGAICSKSTVYFADKSALKGSLLQYLQVRRVARFDSQVVDQ